jgi:hypothetical protein
MTPLFTLETAISTGQLLAEMNPLGLLSLFANVKIVDRTMISHDTGPNFAFATFFISQFYIFAVHTILPKQPEVFYYTKKIESNRFTKIYPQRIGYDTCLVKLIVLWFGD